MPEHKKGQVWSKPKNKLMLQFESETSKNAIYNGKITGQFEYWLWQLEKTPISKISHKFNYNRLTSSKIQMWSPETMMGLIPLEDAIELIKSHNYYIISSQAIGYNKKPDKSGIKPIRWDEIQVDYGFHPRSNISQKLVNKYFKAMKGGAKFPPILIQKVKKNNKVIVIILDGYHRKMAFDKYIKYTNENNIKIKNKLHFNLWNNKILDYDMVVNCRDCGIV